MGYTKKTYELAKANIEKRRLKAIETADRHVEEIRSKYPEYVEMEKELALSPTRIIEAISLGRERSAEKIKELEADNLALQERMTAFLVSKGYPKDYTKRKYSCPKCEDSGYRDFRECECLKAELARISVDSSGIAGLVGHQSFENFDLSYYKDDPKTLGDMQTNLSFLQRYAAEFDPKSSKSLLFLGATGLGKTHLSTACAKVIIDGGSAVIYDTAQNILSDFEQEKFGRDNTQEQEKPTQKYFDCDLLIIDDLGTELTNSFIVSALYNLINTRINSGKPMIITTNLTRNDIISRYDSRIASRMIGEFVPVLFRGKDVRMQKLQVAPAGNDRA